MVNEEKKNIEKLGFEVLDIIKNSMNDDKKIIKFMRGTEYKVSEDSESEINNILRFSNYKPNQIDGKKMFLFEKAFYVDSIKLVRTSDFILEKSNSISLIEGVFKNQDHIKFNGVDNKINIKKSIIGILTEADVDIVKIEYLNLEVFVQSDAENIVNKCENLVEKSLNYYSEEFKKISNLELKINEYENGVDEVGNKLEKKENELTIIDNNIKEKLDIGKKLDEEYIKALEKNKSVKDEKVILNGEIATNEIELKNLEKKIKMIKDDTKRERNKIDGLTEEKISLKKEIENLEKDKNYMNWDMKGHSSAT